MASLTITIEVEGGNPLVKVKDDAGNEKTVNGLCLFGYDARMGNAGESYSFVWGSAKDVAFAFAEGLSRAVNSGDPFYAEVYRLILMQMAARTGVRPNEQMVTPEEIEQRWATNPANENSVAKCDCGGNCQHKAAKKKATLLGAEAIVEDETPKEPTKWN